MRFPALRMLSYDSRETHQESVFSHTQEGKKRENEPKKLTVDEVMRFLCMSRDLCSSPVSDDVPGEPMQVAYMLLLVFWPDGSLASANRFTALENRSTIVKMVFFPSDSGRQVTNSTMICD